jgi:hypothetical protein
MRIRNPATDEKFKKKTVDTHFLIAAWVHLQYFNSGFPRPIGEFSHKLILSQPIGERNALRVRLVQIKHFPRDRALQ